MAALVLLATGSYGWSFFVIKKIFRTNPERVEHGPRFSWQGAVGVLLCIGLLMTANWVEASMILSL
jgi:hypothetical protein